MKIFVGTDLIEIERIKKSCQSRRFCERVYSEKELTLFSQKKNPYESMAANWAAKESFAKALGTGVEGFALNEVSCLRDELGCPYLELTGNALLAAENRGLTFAVSLSHIKDIVESFIASILYRWKNELIDRIIPGTEAAVKGYKKLDNDDKLDEKRWKAIKAARIELAKDTEEEKCICTRLNEALEDGDYDTASDLQIEMAKKSQALEKEYRIYALNILD